MSNPSGVFCQSKSCFSTTVSEFTIPFPLCVVCKLGKIEWWQGRVATPEIMAALACFLSTIMLYGEQNEWVFFTVYPE